MVGSADFLSDNAGELNHAVRVRSGGSTLKPFLYGVGFDRGIFNTTTVFSDRDLAIGTGREGETYRPHNNDMRYWGELTLRESLVASRNVPAVIAAEKIGIPTFLEFLRRAGFNHLTASAEHYGPGLALGSGGATLLQLARAYSALASGGTMKPLRLGTTEAGAAIELGQTRELLTHKTAERIIPLNASQIGLCYEYFRSVNVNDYIIFKSIPRAKLIADLILKIYPKFTNFKQIRASIITYWIQNLGLRKAQYYAGHRYISSTEKYLANDIESLKDDIGKFHPL